MEGCLDHGNCFHNLCGKVLKTTVKLFSKWLGVVDTPFRKFTEITLFIYEDASANYHCFGSKRGGQLRKLQRVSFYTGGKLQFHHSQKADRLSFYYNLKLPENRKPDARNCMLTKVLNYINFC
ncbi:MAG: hypothetical protein A2156_15365 [Deltaproteobacteria bacterium RBG_16_48_10]|nr:MAG: hypothetical protein A2156_15365 [Deltaproteobacteria bacterium RBG_16_48_10]